MQIINIIEKHQIKFRHTCIYKLYHDPKSITLNDQEEACKVPYHAHMFALLQIPGTDIAKCQEATCVRPVLAYYFASDVIGADIEYCQKIACKEPWYAYLFANIPGANIEYCQEQVNSSQCEDWIKVKTNTLISNKKKYGKGVI